MAKRYFYISALALASALAIFGQTTTQADSRKTIGESGAATFSVNGGGSFGVPAVRAAVMVGNASAVSPTKKALPAIGLTLSVRAWNFLVPYADFNFIDTGKATASIGSVNSTAQANTFIFSSGIRFIGHSGRVRPYGQIGGGFLHQSVSGGLTAGGASSQANARGSIGSVNYGGGVQFFAAKRWGVDMAFDGYRFARPLIGAGSGAGAVRAGFFFQTRSSIE